MRRTGPSRRRVTSACGPRRTRRRRLTTSSSRRGRSRRSGRERPSRARATRETTMAMMMTSRARSESREAQMYVSRFLGIAAGVSLCAGCAFNEAETGLREESVQPAASQPGELDTAKIEQVTGLKGTLNKEENVFKVTQGRTDVKVTVDGRPLEPFMGLTTWA